MRSNAPVAIIGFGVAGFNAALAMRCAGYDGTIQVFSDHGTLPYSPILTSYYAGGDKQYDECFPWSEEEVSHLDLDVKGGFPVLELDVDAHIICTAEGSFPYSKCVIASGASPSCVGFPADCGYAPYVLHSMDDAERLKAALENPDVKRVLVSGASMVALKILEAALAQGKEVTLVGMGEHVLDFNALPPAAERVERELRKKGATLRLGQTIASVEVAADESALGRRLVVAFSNGETEGFDEICVAHGMRCNLDFVPDGALDVDRAILVDRHMRTSAPDVYAAGDVVQATELISGERRIVGIWKNAAAQGACAGKAVAAELAGVAPGEEDAFDGSISSNTIAVDGTLFLSAGTIELNAQRSMEVREDNDMTVVYVWEGSGDDRRLVGFNIASDSDEEGGVAYDTGAMLTLRIMEAARSGR